MSDKEITIKIDERVFAWLEAYAVAEIKSSKMNEDRKTEQIEYLYDKANNDFGPAVKQLIESLAISFVVRLTDAIRAGAADEYFAIERSIPKIWSPAMMNKVIHEQARKMGFDIPEQV